MVQFASYWRRVLCKTRLIFPRINGRPYCVDAWYYFSNEMIFFYQKKLRMQKLAVFHLILKTYQTLISFFFSLWIIDEFEKKISNKLHKGAGRNCIKTWKGSPELFQVSVHVHPCHLLNRGQKTVSVPKYTGSLK